MKLIMSPASPFVRKVRVLAAEIGLTAEIEELPVVTTPVDTDAMLREANPLGKIPALVLEDGRTIYDSRVITRYLDVRAQAGVYPEDRLWDVLVLEATAEGVLEAAVLMVYEGRIRPESLHYPPWIEAQWAKAIGGVQAIEARMMELLSGPLNMGQIAVACALGYLDFRHPGRDWRSGCPQLAAWYADFESRPSMIATRPET
ncbi:glutathione S-transferase [Pseudodonghicola flavimaris]|uniref:Glutathione S-transferase n=1 Tax=Pseudodonghicola flavimaris TaxID=3050036 RepID=A0ABT7EX34_9RHOB|nr:glutathione S-transferase [Pseudodonghicola flavimaris]MDK3016893.1 glutathione S-transferase [Pseudodonghicola flavimaris]